jgi:hypothetical protein
MHARTDPGPTIPTRRPAARRTRRRTGGALVATALLAGLPLAAAPAQAATPPPPTPITGLCAGVPADYSPFDDVGAGHTFAEPIRCTAFAGIALGVRPRTFDPGGLVTRGQTASFLARMLDEAIALDEGDALNPLPPYDGDNDFTDVADSDPHVRSINRLHDAGIVRGGPGGLPATSFRPLLSVTRGQMASLVARSLAHLTGEPGATDTDYFVDDDGSVHEPNINALAAAGVAVGDGVDRFHPRRALPRGQMSAFVMRSMATVHLAGDIGAIPDRRGAVFPFLGTDLRFADPLAAAEGFAERYLGFVDPVYSEFREGDSRSGEVGVRPVAGGPETTILVRRLDRYWWIMGAAADSLVVEQPTADAVLTSPLTVSGRARTFGRPLLVDIWTDRADEPHATATATGGGTVVTPFSATLRWDRRPATRSGGLYVRAYDSATGDLWQATVLRVRF